MRKETFGHLLSGEIGRLAADVERLQEVLGSSCPVGAGGLDIRSQCLDELAQRARALETLTAALAEDMRGLQCSPALLAGITLSELKHRLAGESFEPAPPGGELEMF